MKHQFIKLTNGAIIYSLGENSTHGVIHGCNLDSPHLKPKTFPLAEVDAHWSANHDDIKSRLKPSQEYVPQTKSAKHSYNNIKERYKKVMQAFKAIKETATA